MANTEYCIYFLLACYRRIQNNVKHEQKGLGLRNKKEVPLGSPDREGEENKRDQQQQQQNRSSERLIMCLTFHVGLPQIWVALPT